MITLLAILLFIAVLVWLWFFIKTLVIIFRHSVLMGILAVLFSPLVHIIWYLSNKDRLSANERQVFGRFFIVYAITFVLGFALGYSYTPDVVTTTVPTTQL